MDYNHILTKKHVWYEFGQNKFTSFDARYKVLHRTVYLHDF